MIKLNSQTLNDISAPGRSVISGPFGSNIGKRFFKEEGIPVIRGNNLTTDFKKFKDDGFVFLTEEKADELKADAIKGDILFTAAGTIGQVGMIPKSSKYDRYVISNKQLRFRVDTKKADPDFVYYWLASPWIHKTIKNRNTGSTVPLINLGIIKSLPISLPEDIQEQQKISRIFSLIDEKIELNNKINTELEAMAKLIYDYWFVQFDFPNANGKPYKSSGGKMVYNEEIKREIPVGWEVSSLGKYAAVKKGQLITKKTVEEGKIKVVAAGIDFSYFHSTPNYKRNTITVSGSGASAGFINFWREPIFASDCITVRGATDADTLLILHYLLLIQDYIFKQARGSAQPHVYPDDISILKCVVAPNKLIEEFGNMVLSSNDKISVNNTENEKLTELRDWLLPMLMNGQVTVKDSFN